MKKIATLCIAIIIIFLGFVAYRYASNSPQIIPYGFKVKNDIYKDLNTSAPILIIGDSMSKQLSTFKDLLASKISKGLSKNIQIESFAQEGENVQRSLLKLKRLEKLPLVIIYMGNADNSYEDLYYLNQLEKIEKNFKLYNNDSIRSLLMVQPWTSRLIYTPVDKKLIRDLPIKTDNIRNDIIFQRKQALNFNHYKAGFSSLVKYIKKRSSFFIPITTPINLMTTPKKSCYGSMSQDGQEDLENIKKLLKDRDYKKAYNTSKDLALIHSTNAQALYLHGLISKKLNHRSESQKYLELSRIYDCNNLSSNPIYNILLKHISNSNQVDYFDFHQMLVDNSFENYTFIDDKYPQDLYFEKLTDILAFKLKKLLKL